MSSKHLEEVKAASESREKLALQVNNLENQVKKDW